MKKMQNALEFSHQLLSNHVNAGDTVIDGTVGNGHDTFFLAQLVGSRGTVYGFDIQERAIQQTQERLTAAPINHTHVHLFNRGHQEIASVLPPMAQVSGAIFNLGYLPGGNKQLITHAETTIQGLRGCISHLTVGGIIVIVVYYGHPGGQTEKNQVDNFCAALPQKQFAVLKYEFINQVHQPPFVLGIQKVF